jgi:hypothetical protein
MRRVSAQPLKYAVLAALIAIVATTVAIALALGQHGSRAAALGFSFGISLAPQSALVAMPIGAILGGLRPRMSRWVFVLVAALCTAALGMLFGWWLVGDGHYFPESLAVYVCATWTLAATIVAAFSSGDPEPSGGDS